MKRRPTRYGTALALVLACPALSGCETLFHNLRARDRDQERAEHAAAPLEASDGEKVLDVASPTPRPFFKSSRLPGGLSDESREVEQHLGIQ